MYSAGIQTNSFLYCHMPQAGKGDVGGGDPHALLGGLGEYRFARRLSLLWIGVVFNGNGGVGKLDSRDVDDDAPDQKRLYCSQ